MSNIIENNRYDIVTLLRAFGIILMVLAHAMPPEHIVWKIIYCFHMPLFFIMSGYCFKDKYLSSAKEFVIRKLKGIYLPMVLFSLPILLLHNLFCKLNIYDPTWIYTWKDYAWNGLRIISRMSLNEGMLGAFWFLKALFLGNIIFYFLYKMILFLFKDQFDKKYHLPILLIALLLISEISSIFHLRIPYFGVDEYSINAAFYIALGYFWSLNDVKLNHLVIWILGILAIALKIYYIPDVVFGNTNSITFFGFAIPAIIGTIMAWNLCCFIYKYSPNFILVVLEKIGKNTIWIMALHFLSFKLVSYIYILLNNLYVDNLVDFPILTRCIHVPYMWGIYTIIGIALPMCFGKIFMIIKNKYTKVVYEK